MSAAASEGEGGGGPGANTWGDLLSAGRAPQLAVICLGVWLNAADSLVTATLMPSVGRELGAFAYLAWATAGYLVGSILAGMTAGRLAERWGLRAAMAGAGVLMAAGCVLSAVAPDMLWFLVGRLLQGVGGGWVSGLAMVAIAGAVPPRHLARVFAAATGVWGVATIFGPLIGGVAAASGGGWRLVFWAFAAQALLFSAAAPLLLRAGVKAGEAVRTPWAQLGVLSLGVLAIAVAGVWAQPLPASLLAAGGLLLLLVVLWLDRRLPVRLLPAGASDLSGQLGAGYAAMFATSAGGMAIAVYGPALLQVLAGLTPLEAGYAVAAEAVAWTVAGVACAGWTGRREQGAVRWGAVMVFAGVAALAAVTRTGSAWAAAIAAGALGTGFGLSTAFINREVMGALPDADRAVGSAALVAVRQTGGAVGAAVSGVAANLCGLGAGLSRPAAEQAAVWVFVAGLPFAAAGVWAAWRLRPSAGEGEASALPVDGGTLSPPQKAPAPHAP